MTAKQQKSEARTLTVAGGTVAYILTRKQVKNINLRVLADGTVTVSAAPRVPLATVEDFIRRNAAFIREAQARQQKRREEAPAVIPVAEGALLPVFGTARRLHFEAAPRFAYRLGTDTLTLFVSDPANAEKRKEAFSRFLAEEAKTTLTPRLSELLPLFAPTPDRMPTVKYRKMTAKWGICRPKSAVVTLNKLLVLMPPVLSDYVIAHELAHFKHPDHSPAFWAHLASVMPDCNARRRSLNALGIPPIAL